MATDDISICNMALSRIGISQKIVSLSERTKEAIELNNVYTEIRDKVLSAAKWPFANKIINLQLTGDTPFRWLYRYEYPNDCLAVRALHPPLPAGTSQNLFRLALKEDPVRYEIGLDENNALTISTDQSLAVIEYTARVTNPRLFSSSFTSAFAWALGAEVALPLAKTIDHSRNAAAMYEKEIREAIARAMNEEQREDAPDSEFVRARL